MKCYGFKNEAEALEYDKNPIDNLKPLADAGVPLLHVYGDSDEVVPWKENTGVVAQRYRQLGGSITLIDKPGVGHHPHGLEDPSPIVEFIVKHARARETRKFAPVSAQLLRSRDGLGNVLQKLQRGQPISIAYLGGSITAAAGWRVKTRDWFAREYPPAVVTEIHAAIGGTGSDLGVYRLQHDALRHNPDLLFVEFAVNDGGAPPERIWRAMEGIVRQTWTANPQTDICFVYTYRVGYEQDLQRGMCPRAASAMEMLADHYGIPSINLALPIVELQRAGSLVFQSDENTDTGVVCFSRDGVHPLDEGHQLYADTVAEAVRKMTPDAHPFDHQPKLARTFVHDHWQSARMVPVRAEMLSPGWIQLDTDSPIAKSFAGRMGPLWEASTPGSQLCFKFRGASARLYDLLGPDGGQVIITVDGETRAEPIPRFDSYCTYHRIATLPIAEGLDPSVVHAVKVELHPDQPDRSSVAFRLQNPDEELKSAKFQGTKIRVSQLLLLGEIVE